jgi:mannosylglycerate hydrolase
MRTLHVISHTHWDREWYLSFQQFRLKLVHLVDNLLDILEKDKNFKFFMLDGQTIVLDDYLAMRPENEFVLREHIRRGRILIGPWHILPDMFLVGPEAHIRNLLQGERSARKFGAKMNVGYMPDSFGHIGQIPQILRGFGIDSACLWRGLDAQPCEFWWQAPDGSRVLMAYLRNSYANGAGLTTSDPQKFTTEVVGLGEALAEHSASSDFLIMLGNDHMEPPPDTAVAIGYADAHLKGTRVLHSTLPRYLKAIQPAIRNADLPVVEGELRSSRHSHLLPGVLSTRMWIKQRNRACETLLEKWAEPFSTLAELIGGATNPQTKTPPSGHFPGDRIENPAPLLRQAWRMLMENHPHDSICGCSIDQVHDEMRSRFDQVDQLGRELTRQSLEALTKVIDTRSSADVVTAVVVFNPSSFARTDPVTAELVLPQEVNAFELTDEAGQVIPHQVIGLGSQDLINMSLDRSGFIEAFGMVHGGRVAGMGLQGLRVERNGASVALEVLMREGEPDLKAWNEGSAQVQTLLADRSISNYTVRARTLETTRALFPAREVPGLGYRTFYVRALENKTSAPARLNPFARALMPVLGRLTQSPLGRHLMERLSSEPDDKPPYRIENAFMIVEAHRDGSLTLTDKRSGVVYPGQNRFVDGGDCGDEYNYCPPPTDTLIEARLKHVRVRRNPTHQVLELTLEMHIPGELTEDRQQRSKDSLPIEIVTRATLYPGVPRTDFQTGVDNRARDHRLRVHFAAPFTVEHGDYDGHFEVVRRPIGIPDFDQSWAEQPRPEVPQRVFTSLSDGEHGLTVANRGLPEVEALTTRTGSEIALTLLRCVGWLSRDDFATRNGHAGPFMATPGAQTPGKWRFEYSLIPHTSDWQNAFAQAYAFEVPLRAVGVSLHEGKLPPSGAFVSVDHPSFVVSTVKQAEDGRGWIVRGYNLSDEQILVNLKPWKPFKKGERVNLAEEKLAALRAAKDGSIIFSARGHEIVTLLFRS